jgi:hypothetical protein
MMVPAFAHEARQPPLKTTAVPPADLIHLNQLNQTMKSNNFSGGARMAYALACSS